MISKIKICLAEGEPLKFVLDADTDSGNSSKCCGLMGIFPRKWPSNKFTFMKPS
jgi:hypothetical protein